MIKPDGTILKCEFKANEIIRIESITYPDGSIYIGHTKNFIRHGEGVQFYKDDFSFKGTWKDDKRNGFGTELSKNIGICQTLWFNDTLIKRFD